MRAFIAAASIGAAVLPATLRLVRPGNTLMAAAATLVGVWMADGDPGLATVLLAAFATAAIAGFGNTLNDLRDERLDRAAHPDRPLPQGMPRTTAWRLASALLLAGLVAAAFLGWAAFALAATNAFVLVAYELALKALGLPGNVAVAALVGSTFVFGGLAAGDVPAALLLAAGMAALANLARELVKDIEDAPADAGHRRTFPLRHGEPATRWLAFGAVAAAVALSAALVGLPTAAVPQAITGTGWLALITLGCADAILLAGCALAWTGPRRSQRVLKLGMALALPAFLLL